MSIASPQSGYTLPVFACAAAIAAWRCLHDGEILTSVWVDLINPPENAEITIEQVALIKKNAALAITRSDPGDNLDLTNDMQIWVIVEWQEPQPVETEQILIQGGEGIGKLINQAGKPAIYAYAQNILAQNLHRLLSPEEKIAVTIILPEGRRLATRTSNAAFGVVEGLSLLGTTGISQPLSSLGQLEIFREQLQSKAAYFDGLVFCIGENGLDLATKLGINPVRLVKTANWLGPLLVEAANQQVKSILLFGYHGKLIKLAGGIFHTHHYIADGRIEIFTAYCAKVGLPNPDLQAILALATAEDALQYLRQLDATNQTDWVKQIYQVIADQIDQRTQAYLHTHIPSKQQENIQVGSILFDRDRQIIVKSKIAVTLLEKLCYGQQTICQN